MVDTCLYWKSEKKNVMILFIYINGILLMRNDTNMYQEVF